MNKAVFALVLSLLLSLLSLPLCAAEDAGDFVLPKKLFRIEDEAFAGDQRLTGPLILPDAVTSIGERAFAGCTGLTGLPAIPAGCKEIGAHAFDGCTGLSGTLLLGWDVAIGEGAFDNCPNLTVIQGTTAADFSYEIVDGKTVTITGYTGPASMNNLIIPQEIEGLPVTKIGWNAFENQAGLTGKLVIPDTVTFIGGSAFSGCSGFTGDLIIPVQVTAIEYGAFQSCSGFNGILSIPDSVTTIGNYAFGGCYNLTGDLTLPSGLTAVSAYAFNSCKGLNGTLTIPDSVTTIGQHAFSGCQNLTRLASVPASLVSIGKGAFKNCKQMAGSLIFPDTLTEINEDAFYYCLRLSDLRFPRSIRHIGGWAFYRCRGLSGTFILPDTCFIDADAFFECNSSLHIFTETAFSELCASAENSLRSCLLNVLHPDYLFSTIMEESLSFFDKVVLAAEDIVHGNYDQLLFKEYAKEEYLFAQALRYLDDSSAELINTDRISGALETIRDLAKEGAAVSTDVIFSGVLELAEFTPSADHVDAMLAHFDLFANDKISYEELRSYYSHLYLTETEVDDCIASCVIGKKLSIISNAAIAAGVALDIYETYNQLALLESLDTTAVLKTARVYQQSSDTVVQHVGALLESYYSQPLNVRIRMLVRHDLVPFALNTFISAGISTAVSPSTMAIVSISSMLVDSFTGADKINKLMHELLHSSDAAQSIYDAYEQDMAFDTESPSTDSLYAAYWSYVTYCETAAQAQTDFLDLYEQVDTILGGVFIGDEDREIMAYAEEQRALLRKERQHARIFYDFLITHDYEAYKAALEAA